MSNSNSKSNSVSNATKTQPDDQQGSNFGSNGGTEKANRAPDVNQTQQDQSSSNQKTPGSSRGGSHEQYVKAGQQSHKNS